MLILLVHAVIVQMISYAMRPAISYGLLELGGGGGWVGAATASFALPPLLLAIPAGRLVDRIGERVSLIIGGTAFVLACVVAWAGSHSAILLIVATMLLGIGVLFSVVGEQTWVMRDATTGKLDNLFGVYTFATSSGQMLGPVLLMQPGAQDSSPNLQVVSLIGVGLAAICTAMSWFIKPTQRGTSTESSTAGMLPEAWRLLRRKGVIRALMASSLVLTSLDILLAYLPMLAQERGFSPVMLSIFLMVRGLATMISRLLLGPMTTRFGRRGTLVWTGVAAAIALVIVALPVPPALLAAACAVYGFAAGAVQPLTMSWMTLVTPREQRGTGASLRLVANRAGQTVIPIVVAGVSVASSAMAVFLVTGTSLFIASWLSRAAPNDTTEE
ncbi:MFS transporter [Gulosibacter faecalis]|uniref:MFS transporter n=1 Tax=Gulosibacter faecalis TaxID=272240 RepID=A0ABW5UVW1_9MICO|nr:MFS transporter [Gulosibacter faecalis]